MRVHFVCVADEESEELEQRGSDYLVEQGYLGDFAITGEPTDMHIGIQAKGVLAMRIEVTGKAAHGSTPWVGRQRGAEGDRRLPPDRGRCPSRASRPTCSTGPRSTSAGSSAATRSTRCPTCARSTSTSATCPGQDADEIRAAVDALPDARVVKVFHRRPAIVERDNPFVQALGEAIAPRWRRPTASSSRSAATGPRTRSRSSRRACPAVECGPIGAGHHGPEEWVSVRSLGEYRQALVEFVNLLPARLGKDERPLRIA